MNSKTRRNIAIALMLGNPLLLKKAINRPNPIKKKIGLGGEFMAAVEKARTNLDRNKIEVDLAKVWNPSKPIAYSTGLPALDSQLDGGLQPGLVLVLSDTNASMSTFFAQCIKINHPTIECNFDLDYFSYLRIYKDCYDVNQFDKSASWEESYLAKQRKQSIETDSVTIVPRAFPRSMVGLPVNPVTLEHHLKAWPEWEKVADTIIGLKSLPHQSRKELIIIKNRYGNGMKPVLVDLHHNGLFQV